MNTHPLANWMQKNDVTKSQLAGDLQVSEQHIFYILHGKRWPSYRLAAKISYITKIEIEDLLSFNRSIT